MLRWAPQRSAPLAASLPSLSALSPGLTDVLASWGVIKCLFQLLVGKLPEDEALLMALLPQSLAQYLAHSRYSYMFQKRPRGRWCRQPPK